MGKLPMSNNEQIARCPHCGNNTPHVILHTEVKNEMLYTVEGERLAPCDMYYYLTKCRTCGEISLFHNYEFNDDGVYLGTSDVRYPASWEATDSVPKAVADCYAEAKKVEKISPTAFATLIRKAFESITKEKKARGNNLMEKVQDLADKKIIPGAMAEMADAIRILGNIGTHDEEVKLGEQDVQDMDSFFTTLVEYVYVAPQKLAALKKRIDEGKAKAGKK